MYADGYKYWLAYKADSTSYYRCCRHISTKCPGRCKNENGKIRITTAHNHTAEPNRAIVDKFRKTLTHRASTENTELHVIYCEEATSRYSDAAMLYPFVTAESAMRKARRKQLPQTPKTVNDIINVLDNSDLFRVNSGSDKDPIYQKTITLDDCICMLFMHRKTFELFGRIDELHIDGSFEFVSINQPSYYMVTAYAVQGQITAPVVYAILTSKAQSGYSAFFAYIRDELKVVPKIIVSDFDQTMQSSLSYTFPESKVKGCWFHYTEAVLCQMKNLGLQRETSKGIGASALRMILVLPLLPPEYMCPGLETLKKWMKEKNIFSKEFSDLCDYVEYGWLRAVGAEKMSVFGTTRIVSNHIKNFNKELSSTIAIQNPVIWVILDSLTQLATKIYVRVNKRIKAVKSSSMSQSKGCNTSCNNQKIIPGRAQKKSELVTDTIISSATQLWIKTPVHLRNTLQFLQLTSHFLNDSMYLAHLSDTKETNQLPPTTISSVSNFQENTWTQQKQCTMQHTQLSQQESLEFIQQNEILQGTFVDINGPEFMQQQQHLDAPHDTFSSCYAQSDISNLNLNHLQDAQRQIQQTMHQQQPLDQQQHHHHHHHQIQQTMQQQHNLHQSQMQQSQHSQHLLQQSQQQQTQQQQSYQQQQQQPVQQVQKSRSIVSEPPPLIILPHVKRLPSKRRLPLLAEPPPLVPISTKALKKMP